MKKLIRKSARSKTMIFSVIIAAIGAVQAMSDLLKDLLTPDVFGVVMLFIGVIVAVLRVLTIQPLDEK